MRPVSGISTLQNTKWHSSAFFVCTGLAGHKRAVVGPQCAEKLFNVGDEFEQKDGSHDGKDITGWQRLFLPGKIEPGNFRTKAEKRLKLAPVKGDNEQDCHQGDHLQEAVHMLLGR